MYLLLCLWADAEVAAFTNCGCFLFHVPPKGVLSQDCSVCDHLALPQCGASWHAFASLAPCLEPAP